MRGFNTLYGEELAVARRVKHTCEGVFAQAQFAEIQTPMVVEYASVVGKNDRPVAVSDAAIVFTFQTPDGQSLALSYENTVPVCLFYLQYFDDTPPIPERRFFYISTHFRNETTTSVHRLRQFHQVGLEIIGGQSSETVPIAIGTGSDLLTSLGLNHTVRISDVTILASVFNRLGCDDAERSTLRSLYASRDVHTFESFLARSALNARQKALLNSLFFSQYATLTDMLHAYELEDAIVRIGRINEVLERLDPGIRRLVIPDLSLVRSGRMYSGLIYQFYLEGTDHECGGGGEYDRLLQSLGGPTTAACGAAFGLERLTYAVRHHGAQAAVSTTAPGR